MSTAEQAPAVADLRAARGWLGLAVAVLVVAGLLALLLVLGRMPPFDALVTDPGFFRRCLVVHVNLAMVAWFYSFAAVLLFGLAPARAFRPLAAISVRTAAVGIALMVAAAWLPGAHPVLSNYVPMLDHWLYGLGLSAFAAGVVAAVLSRRLVPGGNERSQLPVPPSALPGLRATALALLLAGLTFCASWIAQPPGLEAQAHYELLFWGTGHVLQLASVLAMLCAWLILVAARTGRDPVRRPVASALFFLLVLPWVCAPLLPLAGTWTATYRTGFTTLMQFGLFPVVVVFAVLCVRALRRGPARFDLRDPLASGFAASLVLTAAGFALGAAIRGSDTTVPAHYHASIGAVTVAFMATAYALLDALGMKLPAGRLGILAGRQPLIYGAGQLVFASGFALAGLGGMARKVYGQEQAARGAVETIGLVVMGIGGLVAVAGGVLFLCVLVHAWRGRVRPCDVRTSMSTTGGTRGRPA